MCEMALLYFEGNQSRRKPCIHDTAGVEVMVASGHSHLVQKDAGIASGFSDKTYVSAGAEIVTEPEEIFQHSEMVMHVKEPMTPEYCLIREGQIVFTYLHLAAEETLTRVFMDSKAFCIAYETIQKQDGSLPLLTPMSEVAGRIAIPQGAKYPEMAQGGSGVLLGGVPGVGPGTVLIIGGRVVGTNAAKMACGLKAKVYILDMNLERLRYLSDIMPANCFLLMANSVTIRRMLREADVLVGAVLVAGAKAPRLVIRDVLQTMKPGAVLVDVAIDQGGCFETSRATTYSSPTCYAMESFITVWPTCPVPWQGHRPWLLQAPHCLIPSKSLIKGGSGRWRKILRFGWGRTLSMVALPAKVWRIPSAWNVFRSKELSATETEICSFGWGVAFV